MGRWLCFYKKANVVVLSVSLVERVVYHIAERATIVLWAFLVHGAGHSDRYKLFVCRNDQVGVCWLI